MGKKVSNAISVKDLEIEVVSLGLIDINEYMTREFVLAVEKDRLHSRE